MKVNKQLVRFSLSASVFKLFFYLWLHWVFVPARAFSRCRKQGFLSSASLRLLISVASLMAEHGLQVQELQWLQHRGSEVVGHRLRYSTASGIFLDQGSNSCSLHWQVGSQPLHPREVPASPFYFALHCDCYENWVNLYIVLYWTQKYFCNTANKNRKARHLAGLQLFYFSNSGGGAGWSVTMFYSM